MSEDNKRHVDEQPRLYGLADYMREERDMFARKAAQLTADLAAATSRVAELDEIADAAIKNQQIERDRADLLRARVARLEAALRELTMPFTSAEKAGVEPPTEGSYEDYARYYHPDVFSWVIKRAREALEGGDK